MSIDSHSGSSRSTSGATQAERIRSQYRSHEGSVKLIGFLFILSAIVLVPLGLFIITCGFAQQSASQGTLLFVVGAMSIAAGILHGATGVGLRRLQSWARLVTILLSMIGLMNVPIGTVISGYILYLLLSKKSVYMFTDEYRRAVAETPHIEPRTSTVLLTLLFVLIALSLFFFTAFLLNS